MGDALTPPADKHTLAAITPKSGKHIVLIVLESARFELLDKQLNGEYVAPVMREIARTGSTVKQAYSHAGYTVPSIKALFNRDLVENKDRIPLIKFLQAAGYQLSILSGQDESFGDVAADTGMKDKGISYFDARTAIDDRVFPSKEPGSLRLSEARVVKQFQTRADQVDFTKPQFFYINLQACHFPYAYPNMPMRIISEAIPRSEINRKNKDWLAATYWNAVANADWAVGQVIGSLKERKLLDKVTLVILGDHGESLFDDGFLGHGHAVNDTQTKIPLIINDPTIVVDEPIGQVDIAELTIRSALGLKNQWANPDKTVFQWVGGLSQPSLIAHVMHNGVRTLFDFRSEQVFFSESNLWKPYHDALQDSLYKERVTRLLRDWENLHWRQHSAE